MQVAEYLGIDETGWQARAMWYADVARISESSTPQVWSNFVDGLFYVDCFIYFFCSFQDERGREAPPHEPNTL